MPAITRRRTVAAAALAVLASAAGLLSGCTLPGLPGEVTVELADLVPAPGPAGQRWQALVDVENRGGSMMAVRDMTVELRIDGTEFGRGRVERPFTLPPYGDARVTVWLDSTWLAMARQMLAVLDGAADLDWELRGTAWVETPGGGERAVPVRGAGSLLEGAGW